jgi:hypothetical protein
MMPCVQVHARQAGLHADQHLADLARVVEHFGPGVQAWHLVVDDGYADGVSAAGYVTVKHDSASKNWIGRKLEYRATGSNNSVLQQCVPCRRESRQSAVRLQSGSNYFWPHTLSAQKSVGFATATP